MRVRAGARAAATRRGPEAMHALVVRTVFGAGSGRVRRVGRAATVLALLAALLPGAGRPVWAAVGPLTRYPYLTDSIQSSVTVNWATDTSGSAGSVTWGPPGSCTGSSLAARRTSISVVSTAEYQWAATIPVSPDTTYCYRVFLGATDLLGGDPSPQFVSQVAVGSTAPYSFAVFGDWGQAYAGSLNPDQANVLAQIAHSGARFAVMTGDTAYPGGGQKEYGDLQQTGTDVSAVFGPAGWGVPGRSIPVFDVTGNHGFTNGGVQVTNWPEGNAARTSGGRFLMEAYPAVNGSTPKSYPSMWYAFDAGGARLYVLTASWADGNIGTGSVYQDDHDAHWTVGSAEYQWLENDLASHPGALKLAFWHYPLYADSGSQPSDAYLQGGPGTLQGLLDTYGVALAFTGHAHGYERNRPDAAGLVSYVLGNGGAALGSVGGCSPFDLYAIGSGGSHCGAAPAGLTKDHVYGFAKVTVDGHQVTVTPTDEMGRTFDVQTYVVPGGSTDSQAPTAPVVSATAITSSRVDVTWSGSTDNVGVTGYRVRRDGTLLTTTAATTYADTSVSPATTYTYGVSALDAAGNESPVATAPVTTPPASGGATLTFAPTDDATVDASQPTVNLGAASRVTVDASPVNDALLKFTVSGTAGCTVGSAALRLTVGSSTNDASPYGGDVYGTTNAWSQSTVTWSTAPVAATARVASLSAPVALGTSYLVDVTPLVTGDGTVSLLLTSPSSDGARYYSREGGTSAQAPQLQVHVTC